MDSESRVQPETATAESSTTMKLYAAGLNAHQQLFYNHGSDDIRSFSPMRVAADPETANSIRVFFTGWSTTILLLGNGLIGLGNQSISHGIAETLHNPFGDHNGLLGCLDTAGEVHLITENGQLEPVHTGEGSPSIAHLALAGNGKVAISFKQAPNGRLCHILQFDSLADFLAWFRDPSTVKLEAEKQHFMMQGRPKQLLAGTGTFVVLMEDGEVYSWGDPRYRSLGRSIACGDAAPAERPALVDALGGVKIEKIAVGGWMNAALSEDRALYIWGTGTPGTDRTIKPLRDADAGEVVLVDIADSGESLDIIDVGVGDNHIAVVTEDKQLYVTSDNANGQLGLDSDNHFIDKWTKVSSLEDVQSVVCGPKATFALTGNAEKP
ncbi:hypothetical protein LTR37_009582 [Vermiconidia calcicola]|uniref:Uncharacterized protein n=1 Tax=Vermiconidia calcicola TaxID=1690605 RepID=A0ACC3N7F2_9PEZI|nr:hypothetical protein LTR37_009582 [Vermiconidia calcicola]